jgi:hypothetical protein
MIEKANGFSKKNVHLENKFPRTAPGELTISYFLICSITNCLAIYYTLRRSQVQCLG